MSITTLLSVSIRFLGPILLVAMGGLIADRVNMFNLALEGFMLISAFAAVVGTHYTQNVWAGVFFGVLASVVLIVIYAIFIFELKVEPIICGIAIITTTGGLTRYLLIPIFGVSGRFILSSNLSIPVIESSWLEKIPFIGQILNSQSILVYIALITPFVIWFVLYKTNLGLNMRAVGLNEEAAASAGIKVNRIQYGALIANGILCGLGGAQLALALNMFNVGMTDGRGFTAIAAIALASGRPILTALACLLFSISESLVVALSGTGVSTYLLGSIPYVLALLAAISPQLVKKILWAYKRGVSQNNVIKAYYEDKESKGQISVN